MVGGEVFVDQHMDTTGDMTTLADDTFSFHKLQIDDGSHTNPGVCINENPENRSGCGWPGITPQQCADEGCCFDNTFVDRFWCFQKGKKRVRSVVRKASLIYFCF